MLVEGAHHRQQFVTLLDECVFEYARRLILQRVAIEFLLANYGNGCIGD